MFAVDKDSVQAICRSNSASTGPVLVKQSMRYLKIITAAALLAGVGATQAGPQKGRMVTVKIWRVAQVDNLDKGDQLGTDRADFYALVKIGNGELTRSGNHSDDDGHPGWEFYGESSARMVPIRIKINDDDGGLEEQDDYVDVSPVSNKKDLNVMFDTKTGRISGDVRGRRGQIIYTIGRGDNDKGKLWFSIK